MNQDTSKLRNNEITIEQELRAIYYNPETGYQSAERLYQKAKEKGLNVSRKIVQDWLKTQDTFTRYKPIVRRQISKNICKRFS